MNEISPQRMLTHFVGLPPIRHALERLERELPAELVYHSASHTRDVLEVTMTLGVADELSYHQLYLLALAATFHDIGFVERRQNNETVGAKIARETLLSQQELGELDLKMVETMILDTAVQTTPSGPRQIPSTLLSGYLLDADLSNFGCSDFLDKSELVRQENQETDRKTFYRGTLALFDAHSWNTPAARALFEESKIQNRTLLVDLINKL